jgi:hypothetical protein
LRDLTDAAQVAAILDKLTKQRVLKVTPKEYQKIIEMTTEHAQLIIKWGDLVTRLADLRIRQTANTQVVASLRDRLNYEIPLAHKELQYWKQCTSSITSTGAFTCAARMLSYLQETINPLLVKGGKSSSSIVCQEVLVQAFSRRLLWLREATLNSEGLPTLESLPRIAGAIRDLSAHSARGKRRFQIAKN